MENATSIEHKAHARGYHLPLSGMKGGYQAGLQFLQCTPRPTAVIVINDLLAICVLPAAGDLGPRIPADLYLILASTTSPKHAISFRG